MYADDVILLLSSVVILQRMLDICYNTGLELDVVFNGKKSVLFAVGKAFDVAIDCLCIGHDILDQKFEIFRNVFYCWTEVRI